MQQICHLHNLRVTEYSVKLKVLLAWQALSLKNQQRIFGQGSAGVTKQFCPMAAAFPSSPWGSSLHACGKQAHEAFPTSRRCYLPPSHGTLIWKVLHKEPRGAEG